MAERAERENYSLYVRLLWSFRTRHTNPVILENLKRFSSRSD